MADILNAALVIEYGKGKGKKIPLDKDVFLIGGAPGCDLVLDLPSINKKEVVIERRGMVFVIRSLTNKKFPVSGEDVVEKILQEKDVITIGNVELKYTTQAEGGLAEGGLRRLSAKEVIFVVCTALLIIGAIYIIGNAALFVQRKVVQHKHLKAKLKEKTEEKKEEEKKKVSEDELVNRVADARKRVRIAEDFYSEGKVNYLNVPMALAELYNIIDMFADIPSKPSIYNEVSKKITDIETKLDEQIQYLKKNAYIAYRQGRKEEVKYILEVIMTLDPVPVDKDHIWAKNKYIELVVKEGKGKK